MNEYVLEVRDIVKRYKLYNSEKDRLKEAFHPLHKSYHKDFYALNKISFQVKRGEKIGIIGSNGAGKSTILKILTGVLNPTEGEVITEGRIAALLELGAGFNMDYTGLENIRFNCTLMGCSKEEMAEKAEKIIEFADIGDFINQPVKTYSSGMFVRLAFATQIFSDPDILIVDEALSVGDIRFQQKCYRAMDQLMKDKTVILVTHDTNAVTRFCKRVIWINHGEIMFDGEVIEGLQKYQEFIINQGIAEARDTVQFVDKEKSLIVTEKKSLIKQIPDIIYTEKPKGNGNAVITKGAILDENGNIIDLLEPDQTIDCAFVIEYKKHIERPIIGIEVFDRLGNIILNINSETLGVQLPCGDEKVRYDLSFVVPKLNHGEYTMTVAVANGYQDDHVQLCWVDDALKFRIKQRSYDLPGFLYLDKGKVEVSKVE